MYIGNIKDQVLHHQIKKAVLYNDDHIQVMLLHLPKGQELKPHTSPKNVFCIVDEGEVEFVLEDKVFVLRAGDLFHFKAGQIHSLKALSDFSMLIVK